MKSITKRDGVVVEIRKDGEIVRENRFLDSSKIGDKTSKKLKDAETVKDLKEYLARVHDINLGGSSG